MVKEKPGFHGWLFLFGSVFSLFHILPTFLPGIIDKPLTYGDALDFLTPFAVMPVAFLLYFRICQINPQRFLYSRFQRVSSRILLGLGILLYVDGHGLHLSANSIARLVEGANDPQLFDAVYFFDETISHSLLDVGIFLISLSLVIASYRMFSKLNILKNFVVLFLGAGLYGFTFVVNSIEGQTVWFILPAAFIGFILCLVLYLKELKSEMKNPLLLFFLVAYFFSLILLVYWGIRYRGYPQFSELGWI
jgi:hypothetical protein